MSDQAKQSAAPVCSECKHEPGMGGMNHAPWCPTRGAWLERLPKQPDAEPAPIRASQPAPVANSLPAVWPAVIADMQARDQLGRQRYGVPLQPHNGRDALRDAYEEALDLCVYLRQAIYERDGR